MLKVLLKKQLAEIFRSYFYDAKKNRARSKAATIGYIALFAALMVGLLGGIFTFLSMSLCAPLAGAGMDWMYFALMSLLAIFLGAFGSVFNTYSGLYLARDNDLLLSMPIPVNAIMTARLLGVYLMGLMYSGVVIVPAVIVYMAVVSCSAGVVLGSILLVALISIFVLTLSCALGWVVGSALMPLHISVIVLVLSCLLGWVVAKISLKLKNKSFITVLASLAFIIAYYFFYFKAQSVIADLVANAAVYGERIKGAAYPVYLLGRVATGDGAAMAIVSAVVLALFALMWALISRSFLRIATATGRSERRAYREKAAKHRSVDSALLRRELSRFAASPNYILNCGMALLISPLLVIAVFWKGAEIIAPLQALFADRPGAVQVLICAALCTVASMNDMAAPSVSLEGRTLYLIQSLPVAPWQALRAKARMQVILTAPPMLLCAVCLLCVFQISLTEALLVLLASQAFVLFSALFGLFLGVTMPNLTWTNEITPIKQSASVMIALLGGWIYALALGGGFLLLGGKIGFIAYMACFTALPLALSAALYAWLRKRGSARFAAL